MIIKIVTDNPKCDAKQKEQCTSQYGTYACKLRYFKKQCLMALKENKQQVGKNEERNI